MTDLAALGFAIDSSPAVKAAGDLDKMTASAGRSEKGVADAVRRATDAINNLSSGMAGYSTNIAKALEQAQRPVQQTVRSFGDLRASLDPLYASSRRYASVMDEVAAAVRRGEASQDDANRVMALAERRYLGVADAIEEQRRSVSDLRASLDPLYASSKHYEAAQEQLTAAVRAGVIGQEEANRVLAMAQQRYLAPVAPMQRLAAAQATTSGSSNQLTSAVTNASFQIQDFAVQVASGQAATMALAQQLPQLLGAFGMAGKIALFGSILGTLVAVSAAVIPKIDGVSEAVGRMMNGMDEATGVITAVKDGLSFLGDNIDRIVVYTATGAAGWAAYTAAMALANVGTISLAGSLTFLRGAMMRTGILAVVVAAGELVYQFARLVKGAGGFGEAMGLLSDVAIEVGSRARDAFAGAASYVISAYATISSRASGFAADIIEGIVSIPDTLVNAFKWATATVGTLFENIPGLIGSGLTAAANAVIGAVEKLVQKAIDGINFLISGVNKIPGVAIDAIGRVGLDRVADSTVGTVQKALDSFSTDGIVAGLRTAQAEWQNTADVAGAAGQELLAGVTAPMQSITPLMDAISKADSLFELPNLKKSLDDAGGAAGKAAKQIDEMQKAADRWRERIEQVGPPIEKYNREMAELNRLQKAGLLTMEEVARAQRLVNEEYADAVPMIGTVADAWGYFLTGGLRDFKGFASSIIDGFRSMISEMIATAARNRIVIGITGGAAGLGGTTAAAGQAGGMSIPGFPGMGLLGKIGGFGSGILSGITAPLQAAMSAATQGGLMQGFQAWNASLNGMASGMNGIGAMIGAYAGPAMLGMGAGSLIAGGYSIGGNATLVNGLGTAVGAAILGPIGGLIGGALGGLANRLFGKKLVGQGIGVRFNGDVSDGYSYQKYDGGVFGGGGTKERGIGGAAERAIRETYGEMRDSVSEMAKSLGLATGVLDTFRYSFRFSTEGLSQEEIDERLSQELTGVADKMAELILATDKYTNEGENSLETMTRLVTSMTGVNSIMDTLGHTFRAAGLAGADMASDLADLFGGMDAMTTATEQFYNLFYTEEQRRTTLQRQLGEQLAKIDVTMPRTRDAYMALIEAQDLTTEKGRETYAALIQMAQGMDSVLPSIGNFTEAMQKIAGTVATDLATAMERAQTAAQTYAQSSALWYRTAESLQTFLRDLNSSQLSYVTAQQALTGQRSYFDSQLAKALSGDADAAGTLTGAASTLLTGYRQASSSRVDYAMMAAQVAAGVRQAAGYAQGQGSTDEKLAGLYQDQLDAMTAIRDYLNGSSLDNLDATLARLSGTMLAVQGAIDVLAPAADGTVGALAKAMEALRQAYLSERALGAAEGIPGYARGGNFSGGLRIVGENGPELEATGPARIYSASQTSDMLAGTATADEVRALREENRQLAMRIETNTRQMAKVLQKWDRIGQPPEQAATGDVA